MKQSDGWTSKSKGNAKIYLHPQVVDAEGTPRAVVANFYGFWWNGMRFDSLELAKKKALEVCNIS